MTLTGSGNSNAGQETVGSSSISIVNNGTNANENGVVVTANTGTLSNAPYYIWVDYVVCNYLDGSSTPSEPACITSS